MTDRRTILLALLHEASLFSTVFQNHIYDYVSDLMRDPEAHGHFLERFRRKRETRRRIKDLKTSIRVPVEGATLSSSMRDLLSAIEALPRDSHTNLEEMADAIAVEIYYKRLDLVSEAGPIVN